MQRILDHVDPHALARESDAFPEYALNLGAVSDAFILRKTIPGDFTASSPEGTDQYGFF